MRRPFLSMAGRRFLSWSIAIMTVVMAGFIGITLLAPRLSETLQPGAIQSDGGQSFTQGLSLEAPWPYMVPSHPDDQLTSSDAALFQDGAPIGVLEPSHAEIRRLGGGRYDPWQGTLWFSTTGPDPRDAGHSYSFSIRARLSRPMIEARFWCAFALLALVAIRVALAAAPYVLIGLGRPVQVVKGWSRKGSATERAATFVGVGLILGVMSLWRLRWRFRAPFLAITLGLLGVLAAVASRFPVPVYYQPDSYGYIEPGLRLADGQSMAGTSLRDLGYPLLTFVMVRLGSIVDLVPLQFVMAMLAIAGMLLVFAAFFRALLRADGFTPGRVPLLLTIVFSAVGILYVLLLFSHDEFVINIYSLMAETPHFLPMAAAVLCFASGWATPSSRRRIPLLAAAAALAFISAMFKPSSLMSFVLCAAGLVAACIIHRRSLRSPAVVAALALALATVGGLQRVDAWATPPGEDFGAKILFCNHLDVVDGHLEATTPELTRIKDLISRVFAMGPHGWPEQGFDGDECTFSQPFTDAIKAAAQAEHLSTKGWLMHEFVTAIVAHPLRYARHAARQYLHFARYPLDDADQRPIGKVSDGDWKLLQTYSAFRGLSRERFGALVPNWFGDSAPDLVYELKGVLKLMASTFAAVAVISTLLALWNARWGRSAMRPRGEAILLAVGAFTGALPMTVALSHSFDVGRYSVDILPFTALWWCMGLVYILHEALHAAAAVLRAYVQRSATAR